MRIYIKGFKSIADGQYVALGKKLTFLVGPNSAGKSVVLHALQKLQGVSPEFEAEDDLLHHIVYQDKVAISQALGVEWFDGENTIEYRATMFDGSHYGIGDENNYGFSNDNLEYKSMDNDGQQIANKTWSISKIINNGAVAVRVFSNEYDISNDINHENKLSHLSQIYKWNIIIIDFNYNKNLLSKISPINDWLSQLILAPNEPNKDNELVNWLNNNIRNNILSWDLIFIQQAINKFKGRERQYHWNKFGNFNSIIKKIIKNIDVNFFTNYPGQNFKVATVPADRILPTQNDITSSINIEITDNNIYHDLIASFVANEWGNMEGCENDNTEVKINNFTYIPVKIDTKTQLSKNVNKHLSDSLFIDNGYQIKVTSSIRLNKFQIENNLIQKTIIDKKYSPNQVIENFKFDAKMQIIDSSGRELRFDQIGSGIGYVLPVLIESFHPKNKGNIVFIQQPELHLHPALQASLCDVLIEAAVDKMIISETHSEHLILRALRRIRQTYNGTLLNPELTMEPDDIAINYFEPQIDGSTRVHIMRVAPDGEFIDRWPNGFFAERETELFDE